MNSLLHKMTIGVLLAIAIPTGAQAQAQADLGDGYWRTHWNWYDSAYRPYYYRRYYTPGYVYPSRPVPYFTSAPYYTPPPVRTYEEPVPGQHVVRFGWW